MALSDSVIEPYQAHATSEVPNAPELNPKTLKNDRPSVIDEGQALNICKSLEWGTRAQIRKFAAIQRKLDGAPPKSPSALRQQSAAWQSNISTGFLASVVETLYPRLYLRLKNVEYLTAAKLPDGIPQAKEKTMKYRRVVSDAVRSWSGWPNFLQYLTKEITTYGFAFPTFPDRYSWKPKVFRVDEAFVPQGTPVGEDDSQYYVLREDWDVYDLWDKIKNKKVAEERGWNIDNAVESINAAAPKPRVVTGLQTDARRYEDLVRELIPATSYQKGWNLVQCYRLWNKDDDGFVCERIMDLKTGKELFYDDSQVLKMPDVMCPMVFSFGNGTIYGCKGVAVILYELSCQVELSRNRAFDNLAQRSRIPLQIANGGEMQKVDMKVYPGYSVYSGANIASAAILPDVVNESIEWDKYVSQLAQQTVGAYMPMMAENAAEQTATQVKIDAMKENEKNNVNADNMLTQFQRLMGIVQRRMLSPNTIDPIGQKALKQLQDPSYMGVALSPEEITSLAAQPPVDNTLDLDDTTSKQKAQYAMTLRGNPMYDQHKLEQYIGEPLLGTDDITALLLPVQDQTQVAENTGQQELENLVLTQGKPIPVSPRDNDAIHMAVLQGQQDPTTQQWQGPITQAATQGNIPAANMMLAHYVNHLQSGQNKKSLGLAENNAKEFVAQTQKLIQQAQQQMQERQQQAQAASAMQQQRPPQLNPAVAAALISANQNPSANAAPVLR